MTVSVHDVAAEPGIALTPPLARGGRPVAGEDSAPAGSGPWYRRWPARAWPDATVWACYLVLAVWACGQLWLDPYHRISGHLPTDNVLFQWLLAHSAHSVTHLQNPFFDAQMNVPNGVNMMGNTSVLAIGIPLVPVTLLFGPQVSYLVYLTLALTASAGVAYHVLRRYLVRSRLAAAIGAGFYGFAPGIVHHANGQPNFVSNFLLPLIVVYALRLHERGRVLRNGITLGLLVVAQVFINEELLLLTAVGLAGCVLCFTAMRFADARRYARRFVLGGVVAVGVALPLLIYPIWFQFHGPQSYQGIPTAFSDWGEDVTAFVTFARDTIAGSPDPEKTIGMSEQNTWFGPPLMVLLPIMIILLWRRSLTARITTVLSGVFAVLALGPYLRFDTIHLYDWYLPWHWFQNIPLFEFMYPSRWNYVVIAGVAVLLALSCDTFGQVRRSDGPVPLRRLWYLAVAVALVPLVPKPMPATTAPDIPPFIATGQWRQYVDARHSMVTVPVPGNVTGLKGMLWSAVTDEDVKVPAGYFLGPNTDGQGMFGAPQRPTSQIFINIARRDKMPIPGPALHEQTVQDLRFWHAAVLVLDMNEKNEDMLWQAVTQMTGVQPTYTGGVWVWDVRALVDGPAR